MAVRADLDVQLSGGRASLKGVAARAGHYAASIFGMNFGFHRRESKHSFGFCKQYHHPSRQTIRWPPAMILRCASAACVTLFVLASTAIAGAQTRASQPAPASGFSSHGESIFAT